MVENKDDYFKEVEKALILNHDWPPERTQWIYDSRVTHDIMCSFHGDFDSDDQFQQYRPDETAQWVDKEFKRFKEVN